jgi:hypothetical protein
MTYITAMINARDAAANFGFTIETNGQRVYRLDPISGATHANLIANSPEDLLELADILSVAAEQWADQS